MIVDPDALNEAIERTVALLEQVTTALNEANRIAAMQVRIAHATCVMQLTLYREHLGDANFDILAGSMNNINEALRSCDPTWTPKDPT